MSTLDYHCSFRTRIVSFEMVDFVSRGDAIDHRSTNLEACLDRSANRGLSITVSDMSAIEGLSAHRQNYRDVYAAACWSLRNESWTLIVLRQSDEQSSRLPNL